MAAVARTPSKPSSTRRSSGPKRSSSCSPTLSGDWPGSPRSSTTDKLDSGSSEFQIPKEHNGSFFLAVAVLKAHRDDLDTQVRCRYKGEF